jgi:hypothetical protein
MKGLARAAVGFAADERGAGVAYVRITGRQAERVLRVPFGLKRYAGLSGREVGYAALHAAAAAIRARGIRRVAFLIEDGDLAGDLREHRDVPPALTLSYVRLLCSLNQFEQYDVIQGERETDLTARARSELALHVAA